jgi:hypothetical protein
VRKYLFLKGNNWFSPWRFLCRTDNARQHCGLQIATAPAELTIPVHAVKIHSQFLWICL